MPTPDSLRILIVIIPLALMLMGLKKPVYAVIGYMWLVYCKTSSYYPVFESVSAELLSACFALSVVFLHKGKLNHISLGYNKLNIYLLFFSASVFLSYLLAWNKSYSWDNAVYHYIKTLVLYLLVISSIEDSNDLMKFVIGFIAMFTFLAYQPMYDFLTGTGGRAHLYGINYIADIGILSGHVALANNMNQMIPLVFYLLLYQKNRKLQITAAVSLFVYIVALIGSGSRGGVVGLLVFGILIVYFTRERLKVLLFALGFMIVVVVSSLSYTASRIDTRSTEGRLTGLTHGIGMLQKGNIFGVGPGCFLIARRKYFGWGMESHNLYGQIIGDLGIPGMITWFLFMFEVFKNISEAKKRLKEAGMERHFLYALVIGIQVSLIVRLAISMASHSLYYFYWYVMGALSVIAVNSVENFQVKEAEEREADTVLKHRMKRVKGAI